MSDRKQLIECIAGGVSTSIGSTTYHFERDQYGRFVAPVPNIRHRSCLLSVVHYRAVPDVPDVPAAPPNALRSDGPTVEEYVDAGYQAVNYPPRGYAPRSTDAEIEAAIAAQSAAGGSSANDGQQTEQDQDTDSESSDGGENTAPSDTDTENGDTEPANTDSTGNSADGEPAAESQQSNRRRK